jgi:HD-GYP domain-containing protein (c-di-GMP phosphodiesterase class II)
MRKDDREVIVSGKPKRDIIQPYTTPDGIRWLITDKIPYRDKEGKLTGVIGLSKDITVQRKAEQKLKTTYQRLKKTMDAAIDTMSKIIEAKDPYTSDHQHRVCQLAVPLARELGLAEDRVEGTRIASLIHDIGKIGLPTEILSKPGKLSDIEFSLIKDHSQIGHDILKSIDFSYPVDQIVLQHHERLNGSGYPDNLKGDKILLEAKIIGVADVVEAMSSFRPYRPALGIDKALEEISQNRGILYDPEVVDACLKLFKEKEFKFES